MSDSVAKKVKEAGLDIFGIEGKLQSEWVLVDVGGVVVHIMLGSVRVLYNLEDLWSFDASKGAARVVSAEPYSRLMKMRLLSVGTKMANWVITGTEHYSKRIEREMSFSC